MVVGSLLPCETLQTPVTAEAFGSLNELMQQDAYAQDEASKQRLLMGIQKLSKAAQMSVAECALLEDEKSAFVRTEQRSEKASISQVNDRRQGESDEL
jgi:hypothetical protein